MKKHIPNIITCCNLVCGCLAILCATRGLLEVASIFIIASAFFDFFDGFAARMLHVQSPIGVDMDSLSDVVSFGVAPTTILFVFMNNLVGNLAPAVRDSFVQYLPYCAFIIPAFSAYRLAKFNHDERQHLEFRGLATPANALFIGFLHFSAQSIPVLNNFWLILAFTFIFAFLLVSDIPMFSLKFKNLHFKENLIRYIFLLVAMVLFIIFRFGAFPIIILTYILISLIRLPFKNHI
ncbi:MAG: CDP-alcohol phosphatidyltransferase family protein [Bacteroidales bacterium]|jgi:CDP-diacylglycerol---serine O-phosphatidyltransferase|nr:CDP-alcohol phosphatidyltransferase family protein [Bacteroidales bacterium]